MDRRWTTQCLSAAGLLIAAVQAHAQNDTLEEIVVTATRIETPIAFVPGAVSVVGQDDIQVARQQLGLDESLTRVPGMYMQNRYNFAQDLRISIRGFGARANFGIRGIKILVDGIPETLPDGQGSVDSIDIGATSRIEVLRGPSSTLYGNASGGVISVTSEGAPENLEADVRLSAGSYGFEKLQFKVGDSGDKLGYQLSLSDTNYDGYREQSKYENKQLSGRFDLDLNEGRKLLTVVNLTDQPVSDDPGGINAAQAAADPRSARDLNLLYDAGESLDQQRIGFVYSMPLGDKQTITARNYYAKRGFENSLPFLDGGQVDLDRFYAGAGFSYERDGFFLDRPNRLIVGVDLEDQDDDRKRYDNNFGARGMLTFDQNENVTSGGLYLKNELSLNPRMDLTLGVRYDQVEFDVTDHFLADGDDSGDQTLDDTSPMVGFNYQIDDDLAFYAIYSTAFETPTTTEFNRPDGGGGFNSDLKPQFATNLEAGLRGGFGERSSYEVAIFDIRVDDELIPYEVPGSPGRDYFVNAGQSSRKGVELSLIAKPTDMLRATFSYTYSDFTYDKFVDDNANDFAGNTIPGVPDNVFYAELNYEHPRGWFGSWDVLYVSDQYANNANTAVAGSSTVSNLRFGWDGEVGSVTLSPFIGINNLFDETYMSNIRINAFGGRYYEPAPDRNYFAGINFGFRFD